MQAFCTGCSGYTVDQIDGFEAVASTTAVDDIEHNIFRGWCIHPYWIWKLDFWMDLEIIANTESFNRKLTILWLATQIHWSSSKILRKSVIAYQPPPPYYIFWFFHSVNEFIKNQKIKIIHWSYYKNKVTWLIWFHSKYCSAHIFSNL